MGDVSIMARRLEDGRVQYGWCGNGGNYRGTGSRLLAWYDSPGNVEYLFSLGQTAMIGRIGSEFGGCSITETHGFTGEALWSGTSEREIFSKMSSGMNLII